MNMSATTGNLPYVWAENAFPSFFTLDDHRRVRQVLAHPGPNPFERTENSEPVTGFVFRALRCLEQRRPGRLCNCRLAPRVMRPGSKSHEYRGGACPHGEGRHETKIPATVEDVVFRIILDVLDPKRIKRAIAAVRVEGHGLQKRRRSLEERIAEKTGKMESTTELLVSYQTELRTKPLGEVERKGKVALAERLRTRAEHLQMQLLQLEAELQSVEIEEDDFTVAAEEDLHAIRELAGDLPRLLREAREDDNTIQRLVDELVQQVRARRLGDSVFEVEVEFPTGHTVRRVFFAGPLRCNQPQRVWAYQRRRAGASDAEIAKELNTARINPVQRTTWTPTRVAGAALVYEHFEPVAKRDGLPRPLDGFAQSLGATQAEVLGAILTGRLGPASWEDGQICVSPTDAEIDREFIAFARAKIVRQTGWPEEDVVSASELRREHKEAAGRIDHRLTKERAPVARDASGRRWTRRSKIDFSPIHPPTPEWQPAGVSLPDAIRALGRPDLKAADFVVLTDVARDLQDRFHMPIRGDLERGIALGRLPMVRARGVTARGRAYSDLTHVHVPAAIRTTSDRKQLSRWLDQITRPLQSLPVTPRRKRKRIP